jgi:hypothetical protein
MTQTLASTNENTISVEVTLVATVRDEFADAISRLWLTPRLYGWPQ